MRPHSKPNSPPSRPRRGSAGRRLTGHWSFDLLRRPGREDVCEEEDVMPIINRVADLLPEISAWRQDIHAHPELLFDVHRTAGVVAEKRKSLGCDEVVTGIGR